MDKKQQQLSYQKKYLAANKDKTEFCVHCKKNVKILSMPKHKQTTMHKQNCKETHADVHVEVESLYHKYKNDENNMKKLEDMYLYLQTFFGKNPKEVEDPTPQTPPPFYYEIPKAASLEIKEKPVDTGFDRWEIDYSNDDSPYFPTIQQFKSLNNTTKLMVLQECVERKWVFDHDERIRWVIMENFDNVENYNELYDNAYICYKRFLYEKENQEEKEMDMMDFDSAIPDDISENNGEAADIADF